MPVRRAEQVNVLGPKNVARAILNSLRDRKEDSAEREDKKGEFTEHGIEQVRDPNLLAKWIVLYSRVGAGSKPQLQYSERVLDLILEEINQTQYRAEYIQALTNAIDFYQGYDDMYIISHGIPTPDIWRAYNISNLEQSLVELSRAWNPSGDPELPVDEMHVTTIGHGVRAGHTAEQDSLETEDLRAAAKILNGVLASGGRLGGGDLLSMHTALAAHLGVLRGRYRVDISVARDGREYPPFRSKMTKEEKEERDAFWEKHGLAEIYPQRVIERKAIESKIEGASQAVRQAE